MHGGMPPAAALRIPGKVTGAVTEPKGQASKVGKEGDGTAGEPGGLAKIGAEVQVDGTAELREETTVGNKVDGAVEHREEVKVGTKVDGTVEHREEAKVGKKGRIPAATTADIGAVPHGKDIGRQPLGDRDLMRATASQRIPGFPGSPLCPPRALRGIKAKEVETDTPPTRPGRRMRRKRLLEVAGVARFP
ncbi:unnamed protein product [Symbiodinium microadriaticum]|nr:unnamed protein product [Symbiodinium microadriaticum]